MNRTNRKPSRDGLLKEGTSRLARTSRRRGMPRIMWLAIVVAVVGAVLLFRNQGGDVPTGIGERRSVVTAGDDSATAAAVVPRSGDVDITRETRGLTPEQPAGGAAATAAAPSGEAPAKTAEPVAKPAAKPATTATRPATSTATPPAPRIVPLAEGPWLVQVGSFGEAANADAAAEKLRQKGWDARVKVGNTSDGTMIHRVQIGYFASRKDAETFVVQNKRDLGGAIAVHR